MLQRISRRLSYTNVILTLILVFAMTGGALATSAYVITSTQQISPPVLESLSARGDGQSGPLRPGKTEIGVWGFSLHDAGLTRQPLSFPIPLATPINEDSVDVIEPGQEGKQDARECPGTLERPAAIPGYLCLYTSTLEAPYFGDGQPRTGGLVLAFYVPTDSSGGFGTSDEGTWAVSAPL